MKTTSVKAIWRFPVKSMQGELLNESIVGPAGFFGDRAYALVEKESGKVVSAKSIRKFPDLLMCRASYVRAPETGKPIPPVRIQLPNGREVESGTGETDRILSELTTTTTTTTTAADRDKKEQPRNSTALWLFLVIVKEEEEEEEEVKEYRKRYEERRKGKGRNR